MGKYKPVLYKMWCKSCGICVYFCPNDVIGVDKIGEIYFINQDKCVGCRLCELHCPDFAIEIQDKETSIK